MPSKVRIALLAGLAAGTAAAVAKRRAALVHFYDRRVRGRAAPEGGEDGDQGTPAAPGPEAAPAPAAEAAEETPVEAGEEASAGPEASSEGRPTE
jgi:hypothetical protein